MTLAAVIIVVLLLYTYLGYPVVIGLLARVAPGKRNATLADGAPVPTISICLPVHNGAGYLPAKLESLLAQDYPADRFDILVYCDGCSDDTESVARDIATSARAAGRIRVLVNNDRLGKPTGLNTIVPAATGELLLLNDVRQPLSPNALRALAGAMTDADVGCATGNLVLEGGAGSGAYWRYENWIRRQESRFRGMVGITGPIAMMRRADFQPLPLDVILDDVWIPMRLALAGKRVAFVAEAEARDKAFEDEREFRRKVRTLAGNYQLYGRLPQLLSPIRNPVWFETMSHKILRLVAPWLLLALLVTSVAGSGALAWTLVAGQAAFYGAAALGARAGRIGSLARTFVVLNTAAVVGLWRHASGQQRITW